MNIFQLKCDDQGLDIDFFNRNKMNLRNVDKNVRNIVNELKLDGERNKNIILELQEEVKVNYDNIRQLKEKLQELDILKLDGERKKVIIFVMKIFQKSFETLEKKFNQQTETFNNKYQQIENKLVNEKRERENKNKSFKTLEKRFNQQTETFNNKYQQIENKFVNEKRERENKEKDLMRNIDEMKNKQIELSIRLNKIDETMKNVENKLLEIESNQNKMNYGEFVWKIGKINDKMKDAKNGINTTIYSDSFYTHKHGYKFFLSVCPYGNGDGKGTHLSLFFFLMKGEFDDILQWPFKYDVTFSLINQQTGLVHLSHTAKYDNNPNYESYKKPINERNIGMGFQKFMELEELSTNANLILNNQIFIKCSVNIPF